MASGRSWWPGGELRTRLRSSLPIKHFIAGIVYLTVVFAGGYLIRYLTRIWPRESQARVDSGTGQRCRDVHRLAGTISGCNGHCSSVSIDGRVDSDWQVHCEISGVERTICRVLSDRDLAEHRARGSGGSRAHESMVWDHLVEMTRGFVAWADKQNRARCATRI